MNSIFSLRALAAQNSPQSRIPHRRNAALRTVIREFCSEPREANSQVADMDEAATAAEALVVRAAR